MKEIREKYSKPEEVFNDKSQLIQMSNDQLDKFGKFSKEMYSKVKDVFSKNSHAYCKTLLSLFYEKLCIYLIENMLMI